MKQAFVVERQVSRDTLLDSVTVLYVTTDADRASELILRLENRVKAMFKALMRKSAELVEKLPNADDAEQIVCMIEEDRYWIRQNAQRDLNDIEREMRVPDYNLIDMHAIEKDASVIYWIRTVALD